MLVLHRGITIPCVHVFLKVPLGIIFKNEQKNEEMIDILNHLNRYVPSSVDKTDPRQSLTVNSIHCEFSSRFHSDSKWICVEKSRIAANSQRFRATVWLREFWSRFHSDSLGDSVMGKLWSRCFLEVISSQWRGLELPKLCR